MAIVNRDLDVTQRRDTIQSNYPLVGTGVTVVAAVIPSSSTLQAVRVSAFGASGAPTYSLGIWRFIPGTGVTTIVGGATTLTFTANGTSGVQSMVLATGGSSLLNLLANDMILLTTGGANTAATLSVAVVVQNLQDIKTEFGVV